MADDVGDCGGGGAGGGKAAVHNDAAAAVPASIEQLPEDVLLRVFLRLEPRDLDSCAGVCSLWCSLTRQPLLWRRFVDDEALLVPRSCCSSPRDVYVLDRRWRKQRAASLRYVSTPAEPSVLRLNADGVCVMASVHTKHVSEISLRASGKPLLPPSSLPSSSSSSSSRLSPLTSTSSASPSSPSSLPPSSSPSSSSSISAATRTRPLSSACATCCDVDVEGNAAFGLVNGGVQWHRPRAAAASSQWHVPHRGTVAASVAVCGGAVLAGLSSGAVQIVGGLGAERDGDAPPAALVVEVDIARHSRATITSLRSIEPDARLSLAGSSSGDVAMIDAQCGVLARRLIGPCDCPIAAVDVVDHNMALVGYAHRQLGNGHRSNVIAWDLRTRARVSSFSREMRSSSCVVPPVVALCGDGAGGGGRRVGVVYDDRVKLFETRTWQCFLEPTVESPQVYAKSVAMDTQRLVVGLSNRAYASCGGLEVFDFTTPS